MTDESMMRVIDRGLVYDAAQHPPEERIAFFTGLCPLSSGGMICGFYIGPAKHSPQGTIRLCRSDATYTKWRELPFRFRTDYQGTPGSLAGAEVVEAEPGRLLLFATWFDRSDPERPLFDPETEGILRSLQVYAESRDDGETWSDWTPLNTHGLTGCATTGPVSKWPDGALAYAFESFKEFDDPSPPRHGAWIMLSRDGGRSFTPPALVAQDPNNRVYYWDQRLFPIGNDRLVALFWTHDRQLKKDLDVHIRTGRIEGDQFVGDPIRSTGLSGQIAAPCVLNDGRLLAFVVDRGRPGTMTLWSSEDEGQTWPPDQALVVYDHDERAAISQGRENIDFAAYWEDMGKWSFGHPAVRPIDDREVLLAWYAGSPDCMSVHWARVAT